MNGYKRNGETPFYAAVKQALKEFAPVGRVGQLQLAYHLGKPRVNESLRRAMTQAEIDGLVTAYRYYTERGGLAKAFEIHLAPRQMQLDEALPAESF